MLKRTLSIVIGLLLIIAVIGFIFYGQVKEGMAQLENFSTPPATVTATMAVSEAWRPRVSAVGTLTAREGIELSTEAAGIVEELHFHSGQKVEKGTLLVALNDEVEQASLKSYKAQASLAKILFQRNQKMFKEKNISETDFDESQSNLDVAVASVLKTEATIAKKNIRAPFSGVLGIKNVNIGDFVNVGDSFISLQDASVLYVDFAVPEQNFPRLYVGQDLNFFVAAYGEREFHGKVLAVDAKVDEGTRNISVRAQVDNKFGTLQPGMYAKVELLMRESIESVVVPATAINYSQFGDSMFVVVDGEAGKKVEQVFVRVGERRGSFVAITQGIDAGDWVVDAGVQKLSNNADVIVTEE